MAVLLFYQVAGVSKLFREAAPVLIGLLNPRDLFSAWSHGAAALLAIPATLLLWRRSRGGRDRRISLLVYGLSMIACYTASALFHGLWGPPRWIAICDRLDHVGIYLFIAGSYTGIAANLFQNRLARLKLLMAWLWAAAGSVVQMVGAPLPAPVATGLYLAMGWGLAIVYCELLHTHSHRELRPLLVGGFLYSTGAALNLIGRPVVWEGFIAAHELFHLFVIAGSLYHFLFVLRVVAARAAEPRSVAVSPASRVFATVSITRPTRAGVV